MHSLLIQLEATNIWNLVCVSKPIELQRIEWTLVSRVSVHLFEYDFLAICQRIGGIELIFAEKYYYIE